MLTILSTRGTAPDGARSAVHSGNMGDVLYALPALAAAGVERVILNVCSDPGIGGRVMSAAMAEFLAPLLLAQPGIRRVDVAEVPVRLAPGFGERARREVLSRGLPLEHVPAEALGVDLVLDRFRLEPLERLHLVEAHARAAGVRADGARPFVHLPDAVDEPGRDAPIVLSLTPRYRHQPAEFFADLLRGLGPVVMVGLPDDAPVYAGIEGTMVTAADGLELARLIAGARAFVGAPSMPYALAEGLKVPRLVDVPGFPANAFPLGPRGWVLPARPRAARRLLEAVLEGDGAAVAVARGAAAGVHLAPQAPGQDRVKTYVRVGDAYAEPPAAVSALALSPAPQRIDLALPPLSAAPRGVRFDFGERPGVLDVVSLRILDGAGREVWRLAADRATLERQPRGALHLLEGPAGRLAWLNVDGQGWIELPLDEAALMPLRGGGRIIADLRVYTPDEAVRFSARASATAAQMIEGARHAVAAAEEVRDRAMADADTARAAFAATLAERDAALSELHRRTGERDALRAALDGVYASTSWRASAPLRLASRLLRRGR
ncbi:hypothetical protein [Azospirillum halopraeferens]|uniref:hypothetical protein n=1 Tax=Azospirillum halopraeferens TaxID=34010 RepID=UPI00040EB976|nr:hypothetical protein [Azospirillum halopraeferens]